MSDKKIIIQDMELEDAADDAADVPGREAPVSKNVTGRVRFDERGNAMWEWAVTTGSFGTDVTSSRLKKLEAKTLAISGDAEPAGTASAPAPAVAPKENRKGVSQGYSPYDSGLLVKAQTEVQRSKKKDLKRLSEWIKLREQANRNKSKGD